VVAVSLWVYTKKFGRVGKKMKMKRGERVGIKRCPIPSP
jgi:hypothetical protein